MTRTAQERFAQAFEEISAPFRPSIFERLFEGGRAELKLVEAEEGGDPLDTGVELMAQPRGKRLQAVTLMSGGERALTGLALLFAIFYFRPSPFCVLDEVDAPLDDANIHRFLRVLRELTSQTQFLVITHNRKTMEAADVLYGVTMEEPGLSTLVSVDLNAAVTAGGEGEKPRRIGYARGLCRPSARTCANSASNRGSRSRDGPGDARPPRYLEALEADNMTSLPAPVFAKGFIRAYCQALGEVPGRSDRALRKRVGQSRAPAPSPCRRHPRRRRGLRRRHRRCSSTASRPQPSSDARVEAAGPSWSASCCSWSSARPSRGDHGAAVGPGRGRSGAAVHVAAPPTPAPAPTPAAVPAPSEPAAPPRRHSLPCSPRSRRRR